MVEKYQAKSELSLQVRYLFVLAFVPENDVIDAFQTLCESKTNNYVEGWHRGFNNLLSSYHSTIWKFIEAIQKVQSLNSMKINQYIACTIEPSSRKRKRDTLKKLVNSYENRDILEYLRDVVDNLSYQI
ncbi:hypothetical protein QTP88_008108 [Uroleucon formosanum]